MSSEEKPFIERLGGRPTLEKVNKIFYDKVYEHPWIGKFFASVEQEHIESQQTEFLIGLFGGPKIYCGRPPIGAHVHAYITDELFELRHEMLKVSLKEAGLSDDHIEEWLKLDESFRRAIVKKSISQCKGRWKTDQILVFEDPSKQKKTG